MLAKRIDRLLESDAKASLEPKVPGACGRWGRPNKSKATKILPSKIIWEFLVTE